MIIKFDFRGVLHIVAVGFDWKKAGKFIGWVGSHRRFDHLRVFVVGPLGVIFVRPY